MGDKIKPTKENNPEKGKAVIYKDNSDGRHKIKYADGTIDLINQAHNICPLDSRYRNNILEISEFFSDFNMVRAKVMVEVEYFKHLYDKRIGGFKEVKKALVEDNMEILDNVYKNFTDEDYHVICDKEKNTKHDIKAIEYFVRERFKELEVEDKWLEYIHFGLTSQDVVSLANAKILDVCMGFLGDKFMSFLSELNDFSKLYNKTIIIARTHGQPAIPTSIGREMTVFVYRLQQMMDKIGSTEIKCKFGGAIGNMMAHYSAFPDENWDNILNEFVSKMGLKRSYITTQTDNYDSFCTIFDHLRGLCNIMIDLCSDIWMYISMNYFKLKVDKDFVGSSTMPQKVNPVYFESAEGNFEIAAMWFDFLSNKLRKSRLQRDLTDSTVIRNLGMPFGYFKTALNSVTKGFEMLSVNKSIIKEELDNSYFVLAEAIQTRLRKEGYTSSYETIKEKFIGITSMNREQFHRVIADIEDIPYELREQFFDMKPEDYYRG